MKALAHTRDVRYAVLIIPLTSLVLLPALLLPSRLVYPSWSDLSDLTLIHWPKVLLISESLAAGKGFPLWSPYALSGQPLAPNQLAMLFYPPALLLLAGPMSWAFSLFYALHLACAGIGAYWLVRGLGLHPESALLAAVIYALGGKLVAHTAGGHVSLVAALAWTPWALGALHRLLTQRKVGYALLLGAILAAQMTTHTYALVFTAYGLGAYAALYLLLSPGTLGQRVCAALPLVLPLAMVPLVAALLGAAQLLPLLEMAPYSNRALSLAEATQFSLSPSQTLTGILFPAPNVGHEWTIYPGLLTLALAAAAWRARREQPVIIVGTLTILGVLLALGSHTPLYGLAYRLLPGLGWMRTPARLWFFVTLGLAILAAYGLEQWQELWRLPFRRGLRLVLVAGMGIALVLSLGVMLLLDQRGRGAWGLGVFGVLSAALLLWALRRRPAPALAWLALLLIVADLLTFGYSLVRFVPQSQVAAQGREATDWLASQDGIFRVYSPSYSLPQPAVTESGLQQIDGVEPVHLTHYDRFMGLAGGYGQNSRSESAFGVTIPPFPGGTTLEEAHKETEPNLRLLGLLNGRYLAAAFPMESSELSLQWQDATTSIYKNEQAMPRAFVVHKTEVVSENEVWERLETLEPAKLALVEEGQRLSGAHELTPALVIEQSPNRVVVETDLESPGLLVLSEVWYPGWQAHDNGKKVPILRTDAILRGVPLTAGHHVVEFDYGPWTVQAGMIVAGVSTLFVLAALIVPKAQRWRL